MRTLTRENIFKLYFFDIGLLHHILEMSYQEILSGEISYKGFAAENFIQNELLVKHRYPTYSWSERTSEIEFLLKDTQGALVPLEVKSGRRTRAKSLSVYMEKYHPERSIKLTGKESTTIGNHTVLPLYYIDFIDELLESRSSGT